MVMDMSMDIGKDISTDKNKVLKYSETNINVRFSDIDMYGHVNNTVYLDYCQIARTQMISADKLNELNKDNIRILVIDASIKYIKPIHLNDSVICKVTLNHIGIARFSFIYEIVSDKNDLFAKASTTHCIINNTGKIIKITDDVKKEIFDI